MSEVLLRAERALAELDEVGPKAWTGPAPMGTDGGVDAIRRDPVALRRGTVTLESARGV